MTPGVALSTKRLVFPLMKVLRHTDADFALAIRSLNRRAEASEHVREVVGSVLQAVRERGDEAVLEFTAKFDGAHLTSATMRVTDAEITAAVAARMSGHARLWKPPSATSQPLPVPACARHGR